MPFRTHRLLSRAAHAAQNAIGPLGRLSLAAWAAMAAPFFITTVFVAGVGPNIQAHSMPLVISNAQSIYEAIYPTGLARFPTLSDWLFSAFSWPTIFVASVVTLCAFSAKSARGFAIASAVALFFSYSLVDVIVTAQAASYLNSMATNLVSNLFGGIIFGFIAYLILAIYKIIFEICRKIGIIGLLLGSLCVIFAGVSISTMCHFALRAFYRPLPVRIEVIAEFPVEGDFFWGERIKSIRSSGSDAEIAEQKFSFLPSKAHVRGVSFESPKGPGVVKWRRRASGKSFSADLYIQSGCFRSAGASELTSKPVVSFSDVSLVDIFDGFDYVETKTPDKFKILNDTHNNGYYWVSLSDDEKSVNVMSFVAPVGDYSYESTGGVNFVTSSFLLTAKSGDAVRSPRTTSIKINDVIYKLKFVPAASGNIERKIVCKGIAPKNIASDIDGGSRVAVVHVDTMMAGFVLKLRPSGGVATGIRDYVSNIDVSSTNGWVTFEGVDRAEGAYLGELSLISVQDNISSLRVAGVPSDINLNDRLYMVGTFDARYVSGDKFQVEGDADAVWKNGMRLNRTRWELLSDGWKLPTLGAAFALLLAGFRVVFGRMKLKSVDDPVDWLP